jgi:hypothetical protein
LPRTAAANPHELVRLLEVHDILAVAELIVESCLHRRHDAQALNFFRNPSSHAGRASDATPAKARTAGKAPAAEGRASEGSVLREADDENCFIVLSQLEGRITERRMPLDYYGDLQANYEKYNPGGWL